MTSTEIRDAAYYGIADQLSHARRRVLQAIIQLGTASNQDIANKLDQPINRITGRTSELADMFVIRQVGEKTASSGFTHGIYQFIENEDERKAEMQRRVDVERETIKLMTDELDRLRSCGELIPEIESIIVQEIRKHQRRINRIEKLCESLPK